MTKAGLLARAARIADDRGRAAGYAATEAEMAKENFNLEDHESQGWAPELRRALISVRPEYFTWSADERWRFRSKLPDADSTALIEALLKAHGRKRPAAMAKLESQGRIPLELQGEINQWMQPLVGIGEDSFSLSESFAADDSLLDFPTLLSYDQGDHAFQEESVAQARRPEACDETVRGRLAQHLGPLPDQRPSVLPNPQHGRMAPLRHDAGGRERRD